MNNKRWFAALLASSALMLSACGGSGGGGGGAATSVSGVAATGAAIVGGTVTAICADTNTYPAAAATAGSGSYTISGIPAAAFPCALEISYGTPAQTLHSYATGNGTVNITPLTDLTLALATSTDPAAWFAAFDGTPVDLTLPTASLLGALSTHGFTLPAGNPFTTRFTANGAGWDRLLDSLQQSIDDSATIADYAALVALVQAGDLVSLPAAPEEPVETKTTTVHANLAGDYTLQFEGSCGSVCSFTNGQTYSANIEDNNLTIDGKHFYHPFNRKVGGAFNLVEVNWDDGQATHLRYALSNNETGVFNEINVFDGSAFLGQFTETGAPGSEAVTKFSALSGSYATTVAGDDIYSTAGGTAVTVQVSATGVVTLKDLTFDPANSSLTFQDRADNAGHFYELNGSPNRLRVFLNSDNEPVYWEVKQGSKYLTLTTPMPAAVATLLDAVKALGTQQLTTVSGTGSLCAINELAVTGNNPNYSIQWAGGPLVYDVKTSLYEEGTDFKSLIVNWGTFFRLTLRDSGEVDMETLNQWPMNTASSNAFAVTSRATTDASEIVPACLP